MKFKDETSSEYIEIIGRTITTFIPDQRQPRESLQSFLNKSADSERRRFQGNRKESIRDLTPSVAASSSCFVITDCDSSVQSKDFVIDVMSSSLSMELSHCDNCMMRQVEGAEFFMTGCKHILCESCLKLGRQEGLTCLKCRSSQAVLSFSDNRTKPGTFLYTAGRPLHQMLKALMPALEFQETKRTEYVDFLTSKVEHYRKSTQMWREKYSSQRQELQQQFEVHFHKTVNEYKKQIDSLKQENASLKKMISNQDQRRPSQGMSSAISVSYSRMNANTSQNLVPVSSQHRNQSSGQSMAQPTQRIGLSNMMGSANQSGRRSLQLQSQEKMDVEKTTPKVLVPPFPGKKDTPQSTSMKRLTLAGMSRTPYTRQSGLSDDLLPRVRTSGNSSSIPTFHRSRRPT